MATKYIGEYTEKVIGAMPRPEAGDTAYAIDTKKWFIFNGEEWTEAWGSEPESKNNPQMTLYDMNKAIINQLPSYTEEDIVKSKEVIEELYNETKNYYYMLYGKEIGYFTLFHITEEAPLKDRFEEVVIECITTLGMSIKSLELTEDHQAIEIWMETADNDKSVTCLYLFPYDIGVALVRA